MEQQEVNSRLFDVEKNTVGIFLPIQNCVYKYNTICCYLYSEMALFSR